MFRLVMIIMLSAVFSACGQPQAGSAGSQGPAGPQGSAGVSPPSCTVISVPASGVAPNGGALVTCPDGTQSLVLNGTNGTNGAPGTPGTLVTPVQFCPGTTHYPTTFPEVGFCINNELYAVYSANDGFLTKVAPGVWSSNAIGSSCTFTVSANCVVTN